LKNEITTRQDLLAYYLQHQISPVRQDISDLDRHLQRRDSLYRHLGLPAGFLAGRTVLEVGPGSGHNSLHVARCLPLRLDLVEPNPTGRAGIRQLYGEFARPHTLPRLIEQRLEDFTPEIAYDVVIAEAWLGCSPHEQKLMRKLSGMVKPGGLLITTFTSAAGMLATSLRRLLGDRLIQSVTGLTEQTALLQQAFASHLATMPDMSRPHEDWIQDNLLNPAFFTSCLMPDMLLDSVDPALSFYQSYPNFSTDWRWYKTLYGDHRQFNEVFLRDYHAVSHNFYDHLSLLPARSPDGNRDLEQLAFALIQLQAECWNRGVAPDQADIIARLSALGHALGAMSAAWAAGLDEVIALYRHAAITPEQIAGMVAFRPIFGRELVYIALYREII
jgi:hypothetical protein